jgi:hypothetical protein
MNDTLTCGTCQHFKHNPFVKREILPNACLAHPPTPIIQMNADGGMAGGQAYPMVGKDTIACGEHVTPEEWQRKQRKPMMLSGPGYGVVASDRKGNPL